MGNRILARRYGGVAAPSINDGGEETPSARAGGSALSQITGQASQGVSDIKSGRMSLAAIELGIAALVIFYVWTRQVQGGG
jgi:hypothetical protein